jgi:uncharacterized integral membrane protein
VPAEPGVAPVKPTVPTTRTASIWVALGAVLVFLTVILVFILENLTAVKVTFFGAHWKIPLAVDLLLAAVLGGLIVLFTGAVRILQLRRLARRRARSVEAARADALRAENARDPAGMEAPGRAAPAGEERPLGG